MPQRMLSEGLPEGAFICVAQAKKEDAICFESGEVAALLEKIAQKTPPRK